MLDGSCVDEAVARVVREGAPRSHDLVLVTRNTKDVERTGVRLLDPSIG
jgi:hypothetical protein